MTTTTPVTGYEILVEGEEYKDLGAIFVVSELTTRTNIGIQYFNVNTYTDLADVFYPYEFGTKAPLTGYEIEGKDLSEIFQFEPIPYIITGTGTYDITTDATNIIITFKSGSCLITFLSSFSKAVNYTMYGGGAGGGATTSASPVIAGLSAEGVGGGNGGGGGKIASGSLSGVNGKQYAIVVGAGGAGALWDRTIGPSVVGGRGGAGAAGGTSSIKYGITTIASASGGLTALTTPPELPIPGQGGRGGRGAGSGSSTNGFNGDVGNSTVRPGGGGGGGGSAPIGGATGVNAFVAQPGGVGPDANNTRGGAGGARATQGGAGVNGTNAPDNTGWGGSGASGGAYGSGEGKNGGKGGSGVVIFKFSK